MPEVTLFQICTEFFQQMHPNLYDDDDIIIINEEDKESVYFCSCYELMIDHFVKFIAYILSEKRRE